MQQDDESKDSTNPVRLLRGVLQETQSEFAKRFDTTPRTIARWESGQIPNNKHAIALLVKIANERGRADIARELSNTVDHPNEGDQSQDEQNWANAVIEIRRANGDTWQRVAATIEQALMEVRNSFQHDQDRFNRLDVLLFYVRFGESAGQKRLNGEVRKLVTETGKSEAEATVEVLTAHPEIYEQIMVDRANAARGTQFEKTMPAPRRSIRK